MREKLDFNGGWLFRRGALPSLSVITKESTYHGVKTGALVPFFDDPRLTREWRPVRLPHDYVIEDTPDRQKNEAEGFLEGDEAWYFKRFDLSESDKDKELTLHFEGIATEAEIYLNGTLLRRNFSAFDPIVVDITDFVSFDKTNVLAVCAKMNRVPEGWWYQGGGIYRDVWLVKTAKVALDTFGVYVKPEKKSGTVWRVKVEATVRNDFPEEKTAAVRHSLLSPDGKTVLTLAGDVTVGAKDKNVLLLEGEVTEPALWDIDAPCLYTCKTEIAADGKKVDEDCMRFGFRTIRFDADKGFFLNGRHVKLKGVNCHQDYGMTGIYLPRSVARYRLELMKEMGANAYRSSHNLSDENTMDFCDELGVLVYDETRYFASHDEGLFYTEQMLRRDRNHPSVICWSIGNEEMIQHTESGRRIAERMREFVRRFDDRPVSMAFHGACEPKDNVIAGEVDVIGYNYCLNHHDALHEKYPDKGFIMTESCALQSSRAHYFGDDAAESLFDARDHVLSRTAFNCDTRCETWRHVMERDYMAGMFIWAGTEHRGETVWPRLASQSGLVDLYLLKKEAYFLTMAQYSEKPMAHICPSTWNFEGLEGQTIPVEVYTNGAGAELFLNGRSLGKRLYENYELCRWDVPYEPGTLLAVAFDKDGNEFARDSVATTGKAVGLALSMLTPDARNDGRDALLYLCTCTDENGNAVPDASPLVHFSVHGGVLLGTGSSVTDRVRPLENTRRMFAGQIAVAVHIPKGAKTVTLYAESDGLKKALCVKDFEA